MKREEQIFTEAIAITAVAAREAYLLQACGGDADLRASVDELLANYHEASQIAFLDTAPQPEKTTALNAPLLGYPLGTVIGR